MLPVFSARRVEKTGYLVDVGAFGLDTDSDVLNAKFNRMWESEDVQKVLMAYDGEGASASSYSAYLRNNLTLTYKDGDFTLIPKEVSFQGSRDQSQLVSENAIDNYVKNLNNNSMSISNLINTNANGSELRATSDPLNLEIQHDISYKSYGLGLGGVVSAYGIAVSGGVEGGIMMEVDNSQHNVFKEIAADSYYLIPSIGPVVRDFVKDVLNSNDSMEYITGNATAVTLLKDQVSGKDSTLPFGINISVGPYLSTKTTQGSDITNIKTAYGDMLQWTHNFSSNIGFSINYERSASGNTNGIDLNGIPSIPGAGYYPSYTRDIYNSKGIDYSK